MVLSGLFILGLFFIVNEKQGVIVTSFFGGINIVTFGSLGVTLVELYPTKLR
jgi:hypothetical protein